MQVIDMKLFRRKHKSANPEAIGKDAAAAGQTGAGAATAGPAVAAATAKPEAVVAAPAATVPPTAEPASAVRAPPQADPVPASAAAGQARANTDAAGMVARLRQGLSRTGNQLAAGAERLFLGRREIDASLMEDLESELLLADVGVDATLEIVGKLGERVSRRELADGDAAYRALQSQLRDILEPCEHPLEIPVQAEPFVILMVGVNGAGKTTTIGKMARRFRAEGKSVMLAAGDTFRAAAVEQLQVWGERNHVPVVAQATGADSASVIFDALQAARARDVDVLIADTAGRLHNKDKLMEELKKVVRVMGKLDAAAPHEVMLVLDAGMGQNALAQAEHFREAVGVTGISLTKMDGTARGGIIFAIASKLGLPIRFVGVGEQVEDLRPFLAAEFVEALFAEQPAP